MIRINDEFEIHPDQYGWILVQYVATVRKKAQRAYRLEKTYHPTVAAACKTVLEHTGGDCETAQQLIDAWDRVVKQVRKAGEEMDQHVKEAKSKPKRRRTK